MFCPQCGSENKETARFCTGCGASLEAAAKVLEKVRADEEQAVPADGSSEAAKTEDAGLTASSQDACEDGALAGDGAHETQGVGVDASIRNEAPEPNEDVEPGTGESQTDAEPSDAEEQGGTAGAEADGSEDVTGQLPISTDEDALADEETTADDEPVVTESKQKDRRPFYIAGIVVGLVLIGILSYQLFFNRTGGDIVTYGQIEPVYIDADTTITPKGSDGKELDSYEVTLSNSKGTAASARVKGSGGFNVKHLNKASKLKSGSYTVKIYDRTTKVEWTLPVKFAPKKKKASTAVTIEVADQSDSSEKSDDESSDSTTSNTVYALYYQKVQEYLATYGEPSIVTGSSGFKGISGLAYARLIDFDNDGTDELYLIYSTKSKAELASASTLVNMGYVSEVWAYRDGGLKRVYRNADADSVEECEDGVSGSPLCKHGDRYSLVESYSDGEYVGFAYKELKGDSFVTGKSYAQAGNGTDNEILIDGKKSSWSALSAFLGELEPNIDPICQQPLGIYDASLETTLEATKKVFVQLKSSTTSASKTSSKDKKSSSKSAKAQNKKAHAAYQEVFKQYREAFAAGVDALSSDSASSGDGNSTYWTDARQNAKYPLVAARAIVNKGIEADKMRYLYTDLNGDGVDELFVGYEADDSSVAGAALYAFVNGEVKGLLKSDAFMSSWLFPCEDGSVCWGGNSGWAMSEWHYYQFDGSVLNEAEALNESHGNGPSFNTVLTDYVKNGETVESTEDDASGASDQSALTNSQALIEKVQATHPIDTSVTWKALPE